MRVNADRARRAIVPSSALDWAPTGAPGVAARLLECADGPGAPRTSLLRVGPGRRIPEHIHAGGEESFILEGSIDDGGVVTIAGGYLRFPHGSRHAPSSPGGCIAILKSGYMRRDQQARVRVDTNVLSWSRSGGPGRVELPLYSDAYERVRVERWAPGLTVDEPTPGGLELLVIPLVDWHAPGSIFFRNPGCVGRPETT